MMDVKLPPVYGKIVISLNNCLLPAEKLSQSPSIADGLDPQTEYDLRIIGCELIQTAGILLKLPQVAMATGQVLFQRFYFCKSFVRHPMEITAMGCVCLASKIEEAPRRIRDVINVFHHMRQVRCQKFYSDNPEMNEYVRKRSITPLILDSQYVALKTQVIKAERRVLKELGFCVHVKHPHKLIVCYLEVLSLRSNRSVVQMAWNYMNDSLRTEVFLRYTPETVACACIYLAARKLKIVLPKTPAQWFTLLDVQENDILDICRRILNLYKRPKANQDALEDEVEKLRKNFEEDKEKRQTTVIVSENSAPNNQETVTQRKSKSKSKSFSPSPSAKSRKVVESSLHKYSESSPPKKSRDRDRERERSRDSKSHKDKNRSRRDHDSRSRKDRDHRSKKHDKIKNADTDDYGNRSRSASFWKKFYSYG